MKKILMLVCIAITVSACKKDPKTKFTITYARAMSGPYISYEGVKGQ